MDVLSTWDIALLVVAAYIAVVSLVRLMQMRRDALLEEVKQKIHAEQLRLQAERRRAQRQEREKRQREQRPRGTTSGTTPAPATAATSVPSPAPAESAAEQG